MTNLFDLLRRLIDNPRTPLSEDDVKWIEQYLAGPDVEIHFKAKKAGGDDENPIMAQDYAIMGEGVEVFQLLTEAMLQNPHWANLVLLAANFFKDHVPECPDCRSALINAREKLVTSWKFTQHKPDKNEQ